MDIIDIEDLEMTVAPAGLAGSAIIEIIFVIAFM
jgi:hypothetical protein